MFLNSKRSKEMKLIKKMIFMKVRRVGGEMVLCFFDLVFKMLINLFFVKGFNYCFLLLIVYVSFLLILVLFFYF